MLEFITCTCRKSNCANFCQCRVLSMGCPDIFKSRGLCVESDNYVESDNHEVEEDNENDNTADKA